MQFWPTSHTIDDHGTKISLLKLTPGAHKDDPDLAATVGRIHESIWNTGKVFSLQRTLPILVGVVVGVGGMTLAATIGSVLPPWTMMIAIWLIVFLTIRVFMDLARKKHAGRIVESLLRIGRCPGCGYDLRAATPEPDSVCICPECAAAWKHERIGHAPVLRSDRPIAPDSPGDTPSVLGVMRRFIRRTPTIVDDRNRSVPRVEITLPGLEDQIGALDADRIRREVGIATALRRYGCAIPVAVMGLLIITGSGFAVYAARFAWSSMISLLFAAWMLMVYSSLCWRMLAGRMASTSKPVVKILRRCSICPSCAASMTTAPTEPDGCALCPRCSAAWRIAPPIAPPPPPPTAR